jgi:hypothetical protein
MKTPEEIKKENDFLIESFMIYEYVIDPIEQIISGLKNHQYSNIDIDYLELELERFTNLALELLEVNFRTIHEKFVQLNEYTTEKYIEYFTILLAFFNKAIGL